MDIGFLLDSSSSAGEFGYQKQKDFVRLVARNLPISLTGTRVGVISYSAEACVDFAFHEHANVDDLQAAINVLHFKGGVSGIGKALDLALDDLFSVKGGGRPGIPKVAVLLTDLESNITDYDTLRKAVARYKIGGVEVIAVGVGPEVDLQELRVLVGSEQYLLGAEAFEKLGGLAPKLTLLACKAAGKYKTQTSIFFSIRPAKKSGHCWRKYQFILDRLVRWYKIKPWWRTGIALEQPKRGDLLTFFCCECPNAELAC